MSPSWYGANDVIVCVSGVHTNPNMKPHRSGKMNPPPREVSEMCGFGHRIRRLRLDGRPKHTRLMRFHQKICFVWTGPKLVKQCLPIIVKPLCHICNCFLQTGVVPDQLKWAKVFLI